MLHHRHPSPHRHPVATATIAVSVLALVPGCSSSSSSSPSSTSSPVTTTAVTAAPTSVPAATTAAPSTAAPTTLAPTTLVPATSPPATTVAPTTQPGTTAPAVSVAGLVYLLRDGHLVARRRDLTAATPGAALTALLQGPTPAESAAGLTTQVPAGLVLRGVSTAGNVATVDVSAAFDTGGGTLALEGRVAQLVFTVTQFPGLDTVRFAIDGAPVVSITGDGLGVDHVQRLTFPDVIPLILLEHPLDGDRVAQPIHISGTSNTFEAVINYQLLDSTRKVLVEGNLMATSGTGTWGTFDADLAPLPSGTIGPVIVRVFEYSSADSTPVNVTEVSVDLA